MVELRRECRRLRDDVEIAARMLRYANRYVIHANRRLRIAVLIITPEGAWPFELKLLPGSQNSILGLPGASAGG